MKNMITEMENIAMMLTGCDRQIANTVANMILQADREADREEE